MFRPWKFQEPTMKYERTSLLNFTKLTWFSRILCNTHRLRAGFFLLSSDDARSLDLRPWPTYMSLKWGSSLQSVHKVRVFERNPFCNKPKRNYPLWSPSSSCLVTETSWHVNSAAWSHALYPFWPISCDFAWTAPEGDGFYNSQRKILNVNEELQ